ncbi:MAG: hypothetical protein IJ678_01905, partial [Kiritimatiellae bacterium]|nr:hypothetical protein [Kiritimatiellia bacterium]
VLQNDAIRAEIVPAWAGRLVFFGRPGGSNALWANPAAADAGLDEAGNPLWKNVGGEKTWVGSQGAGWRAFAGRTDTGAVWPPPAWFDSEPLETVRADATNVLLRSGWHSFAAGGEWTCALEREFTLLPDRLVVRMRMLLPEGVAPGEPLPDDDRRLWSVAQVPRPERVAIRPLDGMRVTCAGAAKPPVRDGAEGTGAWAWMDIAGMDSHGKLLADADALAVEIPESGGGGWFAIEQTAEPRHLGAFATPGRAMVFASAPDYEPSPYAELEFAAYGPDAAQTLQLRFLPRLP